MPESTKDVAVVILNYNGCHYLRQFLDILIAYTSEAQIVVIDNASVDDSVDFLKTYSRVQYIQLDRNYGFCGGYNRGLKQVQAKYYVLLNSDVEVTPNWLEPPLATLKQNVNIAVCQPKIRSYHQRSYFEYAGAAGGYLDYFGFPFAKGRVLKHLERDEGQYEFINPIFWASGACFFIKAELYHRLGGFDDDFFAHMEEIDLCWRLQTAGYQIYYNPKSVVYHLGGGTLNTTNPRKTYFNCRNNLLLLVKNRPFQDLIWLIPLRLSLDAPLALLFLFKLKPDHFFAILKAHFSFYRWAPAILQKRSSKFKPFNRLKGIYKGSILWAYFVKGYKTFKHLKIK